VHYNGAVPDVIVAGCGPAVVEVLSECCLLSYLAKVENRLSFLFRLVNIINVQTLTQVFPPSFSLTPKTHTHTHTHTHQPTRKKNNVSQYVC
jgi:hypothetical protein